MARPAASDLRVWLVNLSLATMGGLLWWRGSALPELEPHIWWPLLAVAFALTERFVVHVPIGRENNAISFNEAPLVLGLLFLSTDELVWAALLGVGATLVLLYKSAPIKIAFNLASLLFQTTLAALLFSTLLSALGADPLSPTGWIAIFVTAVVGHLVSGLCVALVITIREGHADIHELSINLAIGAVGALVVTDLAVVTALVLKRDAAALLLLTGLAVLCFVLYRAYHVQRLRYGRLDLLYQFTRSVDEAVTDETVIETIVREAKSLLRAQHAEVVLCPAPGADPDAWWREACEGEVIRIERAGRQHAHTALRRAGHVDGMAAPLREGGKVTAVLIVADRLDDVSTFDREDARLFEALAGHASVALANSGLVDRVRRAAAETEHLSLHDHLTGLPNRLHFQQRLEKRLLATGTATVLLMDLDRFKEVNDTLGHDVGDQLIEQVGQRLRRLEHEETVVARLGGDEFAVLLGDDDVHIEGMVQRITRDFRNPFYLGDVDLDVSASIGIATAPQDGSSAALLLRRAEVAMYDAKRRLAGVAHYSADRDPYSARRLSLISDLARALDERTLELHYQPQAEPANGRVTGVEALLRWKHPIWGHVSPDEFIPLAEHTGLIRPLTRFVVETAIRQCATWRDAGTPVQMAVNVSMRNLLEPELADVIARLLVRANLPAALLKLEVTESAIVSDPERAVTALERMVDLGLSLSVDDFGTGYSSLTRLRNLPVHEVKIDREFVRNVAEDVEDLAIVKAVISLGHDLGLRVVAEGVEDEASWSILHELECDLIQGYLLARPMPAEEMTRWLAEHFAGLATRLRHEPDALPFAKDVARGESSSSEGPTPIRRTGNGDLWSH
ncbi:MAG: putative bifunctional diguanylate cyclase/phosphodiesterase [Actinomycetes bacterium]